jgi:hypothetical protein
VVFVIDNFHRAAASAAIGTAAAWARVLGAVTLPVDQCCVDSERWFFFNTIFIMDSDTGTDLKL